MLVAANQITMAENTTTELIRGLCEEMQYAVDIHFYAGKYTVSVDETPHCISAEHESLPMAILELYRKIEEKEA